MAKDIKVFIEAILKDKGFQKGIKGMATSTTKTSKIVAGFTKVLGALGLAGGMYMVVNAFKSVIKIAKDFEAGIARVASISGVTRKELEALSKEAGKNTVFTARQAADALFELAKAGVKTASGMKNTLTPSLNFATAGQLELAEATATVVKTATIFDISLDESTRIVDVLTAAATSAVTTVQEISEAMKYAGPVAASLGMTLEDTASIMALMADSGISASMAGTSLRMGLLKLAAPTDEAKEVLAKYNISLVDLKDSLNDPIKLFKLLKPAMQDVTEAKKLMGVRAVGLASVIKKGVDPLIDMEEALRNAGGTAERVADVQLDTLEGALKLLNSAWEDLILTMTSKHMPILKAVVLGFRSLIKIVNESIMGFETIGFKFKSTFDIMMQQIKVFKARFGEAWKFETAKKELEILKKFYKVTYDAMIRRHAIAMGLIKEKENESLQGTIEGEKEKDEIIKEDKLIYYQFLEEQRQLDIGKEEERYQKAITAAAGNKEVIKEINKKHAENLAKIEENVTKKQLAEVQKRIGYAQTFAKAIGGLSQSMYDLEKQRLDQIDKDDTEARSKQIEKMKKMWEFNKAMQITETIIAGAVAAMNAFKALAGIPVVGPALGGVAAAAIGVTTAFQVAKISEQKLPSYAKGAEMLENTMLARVHSGERIIPAGMNVPGVSNAELMGAALEGLDIPGGNVSNVSNDNRQYTEESRTSFEGATFVLEKVNDPESFVEWAENMGVNILQRA